MRLLKLLAYALFGYALYEFFRGMNDAGGGSGGISRRSSGAAFGRQAGRADALQQPGRGRPITTQEADGGSVTHNVGRGVIVS